MGWTWVKARRLQWTSDKLTVDGVVTYPPGFVAGRKYPLVLFIHGGPTAASLETFSPSAQLLAAQGRIIFEPNYRGSDNEGNAFQTAIVRGAGAGPRREGVAGGERLGKRRVGRASKIAGSGWSGAQDNGVTTPFCAYPLPGHFPADPIRARDVYQRWVAWLATYLNETPTVGGGRP